MRHHEIDRLYSVQEIAQLLQVHFRTVYQLIYTHQLHAIKVGRVYRISKPQLEDFIRDHSPNPHSNVF